MKQKIFFVLAALMMLTGTSAMAQSDNTQGSETGTTLKGDVNGDGIVDVADIAAVIAIMKHNDDGKTKYYWYFGETKPTSDSFVETNATTTSTPITTLNIPDSDNLRYFAYPKEWGTPTLIDTSNGFEFSINTITSLAEAFDNNTNSKYYCKRIGRNTGDIICSITWKK